MSIYSLLSSTFDILVSDMTESQKQAFKASTGAGNNAYAVEKISLLIHGILFAVLIGITIIVMIDLYQAWVGSKGELVIMDVVIPALALFAVVLIVLQIAI